VEITLRASAFLFGAISHQPEFEQKTIQEEEEEEE